MKGLYALTGSIQNSWSQKERVECWLPETPESGSGGVGRSWSTGISQS